MLMAGADIRFVRDDGIGLMGLLGGTGACMVVGAIVGGPL
jgi:hypothetical protein